MRTELVRLLELPADASEADVVATVTGWANDRKRIAADAAFEQRVSDLMRATNMAHSEAIACLKMQDADTKTAP
jgi:hypothetical protein